MRSAAKQALESFGAEAMPALVGVLRGDDEFARNSAAEVMQNAGVLDELLGRAARTPDDLATARLLRQVLAAGGPRLVQASSHRATEDVRPEAARVLRRIAARGG